MEVNCMSAEKITQSKDGLNVPNEPIIPFIIGDGIGPDIWKAASRVIDAAVEKAVSYTHLTLPTKA